MTRADLLALTAETLVALANRGLVKRAAKDLDAGTGPEVTADGDGTVRGRFPDGTETALPPGAGLDAATCTCAASGACRHRIGLVLAYQREFGGPAEPGPARPWSPGEVDDDALAGALGGRAVTAARRAHRAGYPARIHRPSADDPVASVELPACTVRFPVAGEIGYAHTDAAAHLRGEMIVLAIWAFRAADEQGLPGTDVRVDVGGGAGAPGPRSGLEPAVELADRLLLDGAVHAGPESAAALRRAARDLAGRSLRWPAAALDELAGQLDAYRARGAEHEPDRLAALLTEVYARHRAGSGGGTIPRSTVLGTDEPAETPLRRVRLVGLGCRIGGTGAERTAEVFLAHPAGGIVLVLRHRWDVDADDPPTGHDLAARRMAGSTLGALATANVLSESAVRSASRVVRLAASRVAKTMVAPLGEAWAGLPDSLLVRDLAAARRALELLPPRPVRPRVEAELVRVVEIAKVHEFGYDPGDQRLEAVIADAAGTTATVSAGHRADCPAALDHLAEALAGTPRFVSGTLRRARGGLVLDPLAVQAEAGAVALDLAPGDGGTALWSASARAPDPLDEALDTALAVCAELAHRGLLHAPAAALGRLDRAVSGLAGVGLRTAAGLLAPLGPALAGDDPARMVDAWTAARLRLATTAELR